MKWICHAFSVGRYCLAMNIQALEADTPGYETNSDTQHTVTQHTMILKGT